MYLSSVRVLSPSCARQFVWRSELTALGGQNAQQPWHLAQVLNVCDVAHVALHQGGDVVTRPGLAPCAGGPAPHFRVAAPRSACSTMLALPATGEMLSGMGDGPVFCCARCKKSLGHVCSSACDGGAGCPVHAPRQAVGHLRQGQ